MSRFQLPPKNSTIYAELLKGRICERTGHLGRASIEFDPIENEFVVHRRQGKRGGYRFKNYKAAIQYFNRRVGYVKALHPEKNKSEQSPNGSENQSRTSK